jgi:hypothetical protein
MGFEKWVAALMLDASEHGRDVPISMWLLEQLYIEGAEPTVAGVLDHCEGGRPMFLPEPPSLIVA